MRTLIYGGCCCQTEFQREQTILWARLARRLNPEDCIVLLDTASVFNPDLFLPKELNIITLRFEDNPGHLSKGGGDGAGRTLIEGVYLAQKWLCTYAVHWGTDLLMAKPVRDILDPIERASVSVAALPLSQYQFPEWEFSVFGVDWTRQKDFIRRYAWESVRGPYPQVDRPSLLKKYLPEWRLREIAGSDLFLLPYWGIRNDQNQANWANLHELCPYEPPTWLHMYADLRLADRFLELNGIKL